MLLYLVEGAVPVLTGLFIWAAILAVKKKHEKHKTIALLHGVSTVLSIALVGLLVKMGYTIGDSASGWILTIHLWIIYAIPPLIIALAVTAIKPARVIHMALAVAYSFAWLSAIVTGAMIFASDKGYI